MFKEDVDMDEADTVETRPKTGYHKQIVSHVSQGVYVITQMKLSMSSVKYYLIAGTSIFPTRIGCWREAVHKQTNDRTCRIVDGAAS